MKRRGFIARLFGLAAAPVAVAAAAKVESQFPKELLKDLPDAVPLYSAGKVPTNAYDCFTCVSNLDPQWREFSVFSKDYRK